MRIEDDDMLAEVRSFHRCEWCGKAKPVEPHHVFSRGAGRLDIRCNLIALCRECHSGAHNLGMTSFCILAKVAAREGLLQDHIVEIVHCLRRLPKSPRNDEVEDEVSDISGPARNVVKSILARLEERK